MRTASTRRRSAAAAVLLAFAFGVPGDARAQDSSDVEILTIDLGDGLAMLVGNGGNIGASVGPDGAFLIDDQFAPLTPKILAAVKALGASSVRFVLNTHWHGDHTGGNEALGEQGAVIVAHHNVRERMSTEQFMRLRDRRVPASPPGALPVITFGREVTLHLNGHEIAATHVPNAHTDGDVILHLRDADLLHLGDVYFNGTYPFIDLDSGGSLQGVIAGVEQALTLAGEGTRIIPGHGPLSRRAELVDYHSMLLALRNAVQAEIDAGHTLEQAQANRPTRDLDARWARGFVKPEQIVAIAYRSLTAVEP